MVVTGDEARHAVVVRRTGVGEQVVLTDGAGVAARCTVTATTKSSLTATVSAVTRSPGPEPGGHRGAGDPQGGARRARGGGADRDRHRPHRPLGSLPLRGGLAGGARHQVLGQVARHRTGVRQAVPPRLAAGGDRDGHHHRGRLPARLGGPGGGRPRGGDAPRWPRCPWRASPRSRWSWAPRAGSPTRSWPRSRPRTSYGWGSRCCVRRPPAWPPWPPCSPAPHAGADGTQPGQEGEHLLGRHLARLEQRLAVQEVDVGADDLRAAQLLGVQPQRPTAQAGAAVQRPGAAVVRHAGPALRHPGEQGRQGVAHGSMVPRRGRGPPDFPPQRGVCMVLFVARERRDTRPQGRVTGPRTDTFSRAQAAQLISARE